MIEDNFDHLKLDNQLCFPVYVLSREIIKSYRPLLEDLDLTYPQYLVLLVLWETDHLTVNQLGEKLHLDSGTLTPLLKRLESKDLITRTRKKCDERSVEIALREKGISLQAQACKIHQELTKKLDLTDEELILLKKIILKIQ